MPTETKIDLHPEHLVDAERAGTIDAAGRARLREHRAQCPTCAIERALASDFVLEPDDADRARAARIVAAMFEGDASLARDAVTSEAREQRRAAPREGGTWPWLVASLVVHAALLLLVLAVVSPIASEHAGAVDPIEFVLLDPVLPPAPGAAGAARGTTEPAPPIERDDAPAVRSARVLRSRVTSIVTSTVIEPSVIEPATERDVVPAPVVDPARLRDMLDPSRVARGGFAIDGAPSQRGAPAGLARDEGTDARELGRRLSGELRAEAMTKSYTARTRPELQRRADGSHVYSGPRFAAVIRRDGSVEFQDRPGIQTNGFSASGTFDVTEAIMFAAGQDPLRAERDWFMRHTEELRQRLEAEHRRAEMAAALPRLRGRLERVWATTRRSAAARRARIFALWDDMADDDTGREARRIVIEFVREVIPAGADDAYSEEELRRLNASRESRDAFAPY